MIDPVNGSAIYTYDAVGNILSVVRSPLTSIVIAEVSPSRGSSGTSVTISGTGFGTTANTTVSFHGTAATVTSVSATQIVATVPAGATTGAVSVTSPAGTASSSSSFTIPTVASPVISSFSPQRSDQGSTLTITGSGFDPVAANDKVFINGRYATIISATATSLKATIPTVTSGPVTVSNAQGSATTSANLIVPPLPNLASQIGSVQTGTIGQSVTSTIGTAGQIGLIVVTAQAGQRLAFQVTSSSFGDSSITVYGPDGLPVMSSAAIASGSFIDPIVLPQTATYTIVLTPGDGETGSATISPLNVPADATANIAADGSATTLTTTAPGQRMALSFAGTAGTRIALKVTLEEGSPINIDSCSSLEVLDPNGVTAPYFNDCFNAPFTWAEATLPSTGTFRIIADPAADATGSITFNLYTVPPDVTASIKADGTPVTTTTTAGGQNMSLPFTATANQRVSLRTTMPEGGSIDDAPCSALTVYQPDGETVVYRDDCFNDPSRFSGLLLLPVAGQYRILADPAIDATGPVTFTLFTVPADASATVSLDSGAKTLTTTTPGQSMALSFSGSANQGVSLATQMDDGGPIDNAQCTPLTVTQASGAALVEDDCFNAPSHFYVFRLADSSPATVLVNMASIDVAGAVTFTLAQVPPDATGTIAPNGSPVSLTTTTPGQNMSLTFSGNAGQKVSLATQMAEGGSLDNAPCAPLTITEPDGTTVIYENDCFNDPSVYSDVVTLPVSGTYTIAVRMSQATDTVTFTLYNEPADAAATITPGAGSIGVTITTPGQNASLSFQGTAGKRVGLLTQLDAGLSAGCTSVQILQPDGSTSVYYNDFCATSDFSGALPAAASISTHVATLPTTGTYTIPFSPDSSATGTATLTLYDVPPDTTGSATVGAAATNYVASTPGQAIRVTFPGTAKQTSTVQVGVVSSTPASPCYLITVLRPDGVTVLRGDQSCDSGYSTGSLRLPVTGTYTIVVAPESTATGTFSVGVSKP